MLETLLASMIIVILVFLVLTAVLSGINGDGS